MFVYEEIKLLMLPVKLFNCVLSILLAVKIKKISKLMVNQLFFFTFISWSIFIGLDGILFVLAANGPVLFHVANVMRDVGLVGLGLMPFFILLASFTIKEGSVGFKEHKARFFTVLGITAAIAIGLVLLDTILVFDRGDYASPISPLALPPEQGSFTVNFVARWIRDLLSGNAIHENHIIGFTGFFMYLILVAWLIASIIAISVIIVHASKQKRLNSLLIIAGLSAIPCGIVYFILLPLSLAAASLTHLTWFFNIFGQVIWAAAPALVTVGLMRGSST